MKLSRRRQPASGSVFRRSDPVTIRWATPDDARELAVLAQLDEDPVPPGPLLLALVGDELWVAASVWTGAVISDPFRPSADVAVLVAERARQLTVATARRRRRASDDVAARRQLHAGRAALDR